MTKAEGSRNVRRVRIPILRLGIVPTAETDCGKALLNAVCQALGFFLGTSVTAHRAPTYAALVQLLEQSKLDLAWLPPVVALDADAANIARPQLALVRQGQTSYYATLFSRAQSTIRTLADLKQVRAAWVSPDSASGYLVPLASLRARGIPLQKAFAQQQFAGSHAQVARLVADGQVDVGATFAHFSSVDSHQLLSAGWTEAQPTDEFHVVAISGPVPTDMITVHRAISKEQAREVAGAFQWLMAQSSAAPAAKELFGCEDFTVCDSAHLANLRKLIRLLNRANPYQPGAH